MANQKEILERRLRRTEVVTTVAALAVPAIVAYPALAYAENFREFLAIYGPAFLTFIGIYLAGYRRANRIDRQIENIRNQAA